jgi:hypothetical protein
MKPPRAALDGKHVLDTADPPSLVYANTPHGAVLAAAMFMAPLGSAAPQPGGCLTQWHVHTNLCLSRGQGVVAEAAPGCPPGSKNRQTHPAARMVRTHSRWTHRDRRPGRADRHRRPANADVCRRRNAMRDPQDRFEFDGYERLKADMKREFGDCAWWFDTAALTPEETAEQLVAGAAHRAPPLRPGWNAWLRQLHQV